MNLVDEGQALLGVLGPGGLTLAPSTGQCSVPGSTPQGAL